MAEAEPAGLFTFADVLRLRWAAGALELWDGQGGHHRVLADGADLLLLGRAFAGLRLSAHTRRVFVAARFDQGQDIVIERRDGAFAVALSPKPKAEDTPRPAAPQRRKVAGI